MRFAAAAAKKDAVEAQEAKQREREAAQQAAQQQQQQEEGTPPAADAQPETELGSDAGIAAGDPSAEHITTAGALRPPLMQKPGMPHGKLFLLVAYV